MCVPQVVSVLNLHEDPSLDGGKPITVGYTLGDVISKQLHDIVTQVLMPLYDGLAHHWLLMAMDLNHRYIAVYDSLPPTQATDQHHRQGLLTHAKLAIRLALMKVDFYTVILTWEVIHPACPSQTKCVKHILPSEP